MAKILIVEDDVCIHNVIEELLKKNGYSYKSAFSGTEALKLLETEDFDLVLLDLMLLNLSGEEIIKRVNNVPIIVLSAKISSEDKVNCLLSGADDYVTKPFNANELIARIKVQLRSKKSKNEHKSILVKDLELTFECMLARNNFLTLSKIKIVPNYSFSSSSSTIRL